VQIPLIRETGYVIYEYACHEVNLEMIYMLHACSVQDKGLQ
jgi:hypothetical protein